MNITLGDWARVKILFCIKKKKSLTPCYIYIYIYNFTTNTIYIITYFSTCWDNKLWIVEDHFHINLLLI